MSTQEKESPSDQKVIAETSSTSSVTDNDAPSQHKESPKYVAPTPVPPVPSASYSSSSSGGHVVRPTPTLPTIPLSWQCFSSLMFCGPQKMADNAMVCIAPSVRQLCCFVVSLSLFHTHILPSHVDQFHSIHFVIVVAFLSIYCCIHRTLAASPSLRIYL